VINDIVLVPQYHDGGTDGVTKEMDDDAKAIFQLAFPGKTIIGIDASYAILYGGAIHCVAVTLPRVPWT
jgi:agmatine/peptidylarginine deiminase